MNYLIIGTGITLALCIFSWLLFLCIDGSKKAMAAMFVLVSVFFALVAKDIKEKGIKEDDRPCVRYETSMQFNAATKTMMPVRYCAQYGEWVHDD